MFSPHTHTHTHTHIYIGRKPLIIYEYIILYTYIYILLYQWSLKTAIRNSLNMLELSPTYVDKWKYLCNFLVTKLVYLFRYFADRASQYIYLNINQLDALNFIMSLFHASICFEHKCTSSGGQNCSIKSLVLSHNFALLTMSTCARNMYRHEINSL